MANVEKVSIALTTEQIAAIRRVVASGDYASTSEVVREALRNWQDNRALRDSELRRAQALWDEGLASGPGRLGGIDAIKAESRKRA